MQLKASTDYGLRALLYLAMQDRVCSSKEISEKACIPRDYLIQIAQLERDAGLIESRSGKNGGYMIAKPACDISLLEVLNTLEAESHYSTKMRHTNRSSKLENDDIRKALDLIFSSYDSFLESITLDTLLNCSQDPEMATRFLAECLKQESMRLAGLSNAPA